MQLGGNALHRPGFRARLASAGALFFGQIRAERIVDALMLTCPRRNRQGGLENEAYTSASRVGGTAVRRYRPACRRSSGSFRTGPRRTPRHTKTTALKLGSVCKFRGRSRQSGRLN